MDGDPDHPLYRYGGMWKNKHEAVSAKKPKPKMKPKSTGKTGSSEQVDEADEGASVGEQHDAEGVLEANTAIDGDEDINALWKGNSVQYTANERVNHEGRTWICRKTHKSEANKPPHKAQSLWKGKARLVDP